MVIRSVGVVGNYLASRTDVVQARSAAVCPDESTTQTAVAFCADS